MDNKFQIKQFNDKLLTYFYVNYNLKFYCSDQNNTFLSIHLL